MEITFELILFILFIWLLAYIFVGAIISRICECIERIHHYQEQRLMNDGIMQTRESQKKNKEKNPGDEMID